VPTLPRRWLTIVLALGAIAQLAIVLGGAGDPLALSPINDAKVYWDWGGRIAAGRLVDDTPFMSAPLYPYLVGVVRALGGGLLALQLVQVALHLATAWFVARVARRHLGEAGACAAVVIYLLLRDPAYMTTRVLNSTLQLAATAWAWDAWMVAAERRTRASSSTAGLALGVAVLANPVLAPLLLLLPAWHWWRARRGGDALASMAVALACVAPATIHNALASGEFIPLSAQSGLGLHHGNQHGATGIYQAAEGVSTDRARQTAMAREAVRERTDGSWSATDREYRRMALAYLAEDPARTIALEARKLWWLVGGTVYGDVYTPELEREDGRHAWLWLAPVPLAWWTVPALLVAALAALRRPRDLAPGLLMFAASVLVVLVFWYSPRYRLPMAPFAAVAGAWCVLRLVDGATPRLLRAAVGASFVASVLASASLRASGADAPEAFRAQYLHNSGVALAQLGRHAEALVEFERAERQGSRAAGAAKAEMLRRMGRVDDALQAAQAAAARAPRDLAARRSLAVALAQAGRLEEAAREFEAVLREDTVDAEAISGLANTHVQRGDPRSAVPLYERALALAPADAATHANLGRARLALGEFDAARSSFERAAALDPRMASAHAGLAEAALALGDATAAIVHLREAWRARPGAEEALALAWWLVVAPAPATHDADEALRVLADHEGELGDDPRWLDARAAALARRGAWDEARLAQARAIARAKEMGYAQALPELEARAASYARREPWTLR
jgi:tetratricopeptide (TPR) repeat protein